MYFLSLLTVVSEHVPPMIIYISNFCMSISVWGIWGCYCSSVSVSVFFQVVVLTLILKCSLVLNFSRAYITVMAAGLGVKKHFPSLFFWGSVQFRMVSVRSVKPISAQLRLSEASPALPLKHLGLTDLRHRGGILRTKIFFLRSLLQFKRLWLLPRYNFRHDLSLIHI